MLPNKSRGRNARSLEEDIMELMLKFLFVAAVMAFTAGMASAHPTTVGVDRRQVVQRVRIADGVHDRELTRAELRRLRAGQRHIRRMERRAKADGVMTAAERRRLLRAQRHESRLIYRLKHNQRTR